MPSIRGYISFETRLIDGIVHWRRGCMSKLLFQARRKVDCIKAVTVFAASCLIAHFLRTMLWLSSSLSFLTLNVTNILWSQFYGHDCPQTWRYETRELWGYFYFCCRGESAVGFRSYLHFCKNEVFNRDRYLKLFCTYKKINNIFLKFNHSLLKMPKIVDIG